MKMHRDVVAWLLMPSFALHATRAALAAGLLLCIGDVALAQPNPPPAMAAVLRYAKPGQLVDIGGRRINLYCSGSGGPTVILMAGSSSWSFVWYLTQPGETIESSGSLSTRPWRISLLAACIA